jgi:hypothetical protein
VLAQLAWHLARDALAIKRQDRISRLNARAQRRRIRFELTREPRVTIAKNRHPVRIAIDQGHMKPEQFFAATLRERCANDQRLGGLRTRMDRQLVLAILRNDCLVETVIRVAHADRCSWCSGPSNNDLLFQYVQPTTRAPDKNITAKAHAPC